MKAEIERQFDKMLKYGIIEVFVKVTKKAGEFFNPKGSLRN
jgi:hypothetical protein